MRLHQAPGHARNYDKWAFTCQAKWSELGTDYVLTSSDPRKEGNVRQVPYSAEEVDSAIKIKMAQIDRDVEIANDAVRKSGEVLTTENMQLPDYSTLPDYANKTRDETTAEKRRRELKYDTDKATIWSAIVASCGDEPLTVIRQADGNT